ncbi:hypothetical protein KSP39_PZI009348 [Platanthera zijinensis]|uniref:Uncharacterized protein n=1 Tax=Platanthera zijinensis TaxID=2320716 RepID=A0AAP0BMA1_9ASPA
MAEDFQPSYWWNNSASAGGFDRRSQPIPSPPSSSLSPSTATPDAIRSRGKTECSSFHSLLQDHDPSTRPLSRLELGEASSTIPFKDGNSSSSPSSSSSNMYSSSILQGLVEQSSGFQRPCLDNQRKTAHGCYQSDQMMDFHGVLINETQQPLWKQFGDANYNPLWSNASAGGFYPSPLPPSRTQISEPSSGCRKTAMVDYYSTFF